MHMQRNALPMTCCYMRAGWHWSLHVSCLTGIDLIIRMCLSALAQKLPHGFPVFKNLTLQWQKTCCSLADCGLQYAVRINIRVEIAFWLQTTSLLMKIRVLRRRHTVDAYLAVLGKDACCQLAQTAGTARPQSECQNSACSSECAGLRNCRTSGHNMTDTAISSFKMTGRGAF